MDKPNFYERMQEAKRRKQQRIEQEQLMAEFMAHPDTFNQRPITEEDMKMDAAFQQLSQKLIPNKIEEQIQRLREQADGKGL
jgi:arsenate reductase-like glutaredoxin family protein